MVFLLLENGDYYDHFHHSFLSFLCRHTTHQSRSNDCCRNVKRKPRGIKRSGRRPLYSSSRVMNTPQQHKTQRGEKNRLVRVMFTLISNEVIDSWLRNITSLISQNAEQFLPSKVCNCNKRPYFYCLVYLVMYHWIPRSAISKGHVSKLNGNFTSKEKLFRI